MLEIDARGFGLARLSGLNALPPVQRMLLLARLAEFFAAFIASSENDLAGIWQNPNR